MYGYIPVKKGERKMQKILVALVIMLSASFAYAQESADLKEEAVEQESQNVVEEDNANPCDGLSCANHGQCVVKQGDPICACDEGYEADPTTGLSCRPIQAAVQPVPEKELTEQEQVEHILGANKGRLDAKYQEYVKLGGSSFADYMYRDFTKKRNAGIPVLLLGLTSYGVAIGLAVKNNTSANPSKGLAVGTVICSLTGTTMIIVGSVLTGKGNKGRKKLRPALSGEKVASSKDIISFAGLGASLSDKGSPNGAAINFQF